MTVSEAITKSGLTPSASYTGIETANDFVLAFQIDSTQTKESQWIVCADHVKEHSGSLNATTEDARHVVVLVFFRFQEGVVVIIAQIDIIAQIRQIVAILDVVVGIFKRYEFRLFKNRIQFFLIDLFFSNARFGGRFKIGSRIGNTGIGRNDRIAIQIIKFLARFRVNALGTKFRFCHV